MKVKVEIISVQLRIVVLTISVEVCPSLSAKGFKISIILGKEIQSANEMSRNNVLNLHSHPAIEHFAHFLFLLLLNYFSDMQEKTLLYSKREV